MIFNESKDYWSKPCSESLSIERSESKNWHDAKSYSGWYAPENVYDGDLATFYTPHENDADGNFLKLHLSRKFSIDTVKLTDQNICGQNEIIGTAVMVYSTEDGLETKVSDCGGHISAAGTPNSTYSCIYFWQRANFPHVWHHFVWDRLFLLHTVVQSEFKLQKLMIYKPKFCVIIVFCYLTKPFEFLFDGIVNEKARKTDLMASIVEMLGNKTCKC